MSLGAVADAETPAALLPRAPRRRSCARRGWSSRCAAPTAATASRAAPTRSRCSRSSRRSRARSRRWSASGRPRGPGPVLARDRRRSRLRDEAPVDPGPRRHHAGARRDDTGRPRRVRRPARRESPCRKRRLGDRPGRTSQREETESMADLEISNLHVSAEGKEILKGLDLGRLQGPDPRADGPERVRQVDPGERDHGSPGVRGDRRRDPLRRRGHHRGRSRGALADGAVHGVPVPGRGPRRHRRQVPADDRQRPSRGARRGRDQAQGLPQARPRRRWSSSTSRATSRAATSTTASRAARRSEWRFCSWRC